MSQLLRQANVDHGRCAKCDHDLFVKSDGKVYCSNTICVFTTKPHPTGDILNHGKAK